jgi:hypothetical protein
MTQDQIKEFHYAKTVKIDPLYKGDNRLIFHVYLNAKDLPTGLPTEVNPREVNSKKAVYKKIVSGLTEDNESFYLNNRGILISAKHVTVDPLNNIIKLNIGDGSDNDNTLYGVLDGGHTYHALINHREELDDDKTQYVHLEIMTNVRNIDELASARNTSVQVSDKAIAELADKFGFVKDAIKDESYANDVSYRENEDKRLDSVDLVRLMFAFNSLKFNSSTPTQPISAYSGKAQVLKDYLNQYKGEDGGDSQYKKIAPLLPTITRLYDTIELEMNDAYADTVSGNSKFGRVKGVETKKTATKYYEWETNYAISQGLIFPIIAAFRSLIKEDENGNLEFAEDPITVWKQVKNKLVANTIEMSRSLGNNPQSAGKNASLWTQNYDAVNTEYLQIQLQKLQALGK